MKAWYDRNTRKRHFSPGDKVVVLLPTEISKMTATWKGPFRIVRKLSDTKYQLNVGAHRSLVTYHINLLKIYNRNIVMNIHDFKIYSVDLIFYLWIILFRSVDILFSFMD
jgi:hypothetical protein